MSNNYKKRVNNAIKNDKDFKDNKAQRTKNFLAYVLAAFMLVWSICSVLGTIAFFRTNKQESNVITAYAENGYIEDEDYNYDEIKLNTRGYFANHLSYPYTFMPDNMQLYESVTMNGVTITLRDGGRLRLDGAPERTFELVLSTLDDYQGNFVASGQYLYLYTGQADVLKPFQCIICYYERPSSTTPIYYDMRNGPLLWNSNYKFSHTFIRCRTGDAYGRLDVYPSLFVLNGSVADDFESVMNTHTGEDYYYTPLSLGYYIGYEDGTKNGIEIGYNNALDDLKKGYFANIDFSAIVYEYTNTVTGLIGYSFNLFDPVFYDNRIDFDGAILSAYNAEKALRGDVDISKFRIYLHFNKVYEAEVFSGLGGFSRYADFQSLTMGYTSFDERTNIQNVLNNGSSFVFGQPNAAVYPDTYRGMNYAAIFNIGIELPGISIKPVPWEDVIPSNSLFIEFDYIPWEGETTLLPTLTAFGASSIVYDNGYDVGYEKGFQAGIKDQLNNNAVYNQGYNAGYNVGWDVGYNQGADNEYTFKKLLSAIIDTPIQVFAQVFDFNVLGVNLTQFFFSLLSVCFILTIIKLLI